MTLNGPPGTIRVADPPNNNANSVRPTTHPIRDGCDDAFLSWVIVLSYMHRCEPHVFRTAKYASSTNF